MIASLLGSTLVWYDFFLFVRASGMVFEHLYFPAAVPLAGTLLLLGMFGSGFVTRPLGGLIFGYIGDRYGRRPMLVGALVLTAVPTGMIPLLPPYWTIGLIAPIVLVILRLVQGLGLGGVWGAAVVLSWEHARSNRRGLVAAWALVGMPAGYFLAAVALNTMSTVLPTHDYLAWGWRVPFLLSLVLVAVAWWTQQNVAQASAFATPAGSRTQARLPLVEVVRRYPRHLLVAIGVTIGVEVAFYTFSFGFSLSYFLNAAGMPPSEAIILLTGGPVLLAGLIPGFAALSDHYGRRRVCLLGLLATAVHAMAFFPLVDTLSRPLMVVVFVVGLVAFAALCGPTAALLAELFPFSLRCTGISAGYQFGALLGGTLVQFLLVRGSFPGPHTVATYTLAALAVAALALAFVRPETPQDAPAATPDIPGPAEHRPCSSP
ncbi:MFS transporter [Streptomyces noursei]|uniref:MFS transporter n=1 Tax=Streptomyces noursei TaxID=1971 RepID=UPI00381B61D0